MPGQGASSTKAAASTRPETTETSVAAGASIELLGFEINAVMEVSTDQKTIRALVMPGMGIDGSQTVTFNEMTTRIQNQFGTKISTEGVSSVLEFVGMDPKTLEVGLNQAFLLYDSSMPDGNTMEFAFSISIVNGTITKQPVAFTIKSISFGVWNSSRPKILKNMGMGSIDSLLADELA